MDSGSSFIPADQAAPLADSTGIRLVQMPQQTLVRAREDDWTGIVDRGERRKLQNRLSQRAYRECYPYSVMDSNRLAVILDIRS